MSNRLVAFLIIGLVTAERLYELRRAGANTQALLAAGGREYGRGHYPLIVLLHAAWLIAIAIACALEIPPINRLPLTGFILLQPLRLWVLKTLGPYWTTRVIRVTGAPIIRTGPFSLLRHPNYAIVVAEIALLPLVFGLWQLALIFTIANAALLVWRLRVEELALSETTSNV